MFEFRERPLGAGPASLMWTRVNKETLNLGPPQAERRAAYVISVAPGAGPINSEAVAFYTSVHTQHWRCADGGAPVSNHSLAGTGRGRGRMSHGRAVDEETGARLHWTGRICVRRMHDEPTSLKSETSGKNHQ